MKGLVSFVTKVSREEKLFSIIKWKFLDNFPTNQRSGVWKAVLKTAGET